MTDMSGEFVVNEEGVGIIIGNVMMLVFAVVAVTVVGVVVMVVIVVIVMVVVVPERGSENTVIVNKPISSMIYNTDHDHAQYKVFNCEYQHVF